MKKQFAVSFSGVAIVEVDTDENQSDLYDSILLEFGKKTDLMDDVEETSVISEIAQTP